jgi:hypothetical protein
MLVRRAGLVADLLNTEYSVYRCEVWICNGWKDPLGSQRMGAKIKTNKTNCNLVSSQSQ